MEFMKPKLFIIALFMCMTASAAFADAILLEFVGAPSSERIVLTWRTGEEVGINLFVVERSLDKKQFITAGEVPAIGDNSEYEFTDRDLMGVSSIYYYRLKIRRLDGTYQMSEVITVIPKISSFAKTWGSIKALFQ